MFLIRNKYLILLYLSLIILIFALWDQKAVITLINNIYYKKDFEYAASIPVSYWEKDYANQKIKSKYKVAIFTANGGEYWLAMRTKKALENMGWQGKIFYISPLSVDAEFVEYNPDITLYFGIRGLRNQEFFFKGPIGNHRSKKYFYYYDSLTDRISFLKDFKAAREFFLFSDGALVKSHSIYLLEQFYREEVNRDLIVLHFMDLVNELHYPPAEPKSIFYSGMQWDKERSGEEFVKLIKKINTKIKVNIYGYMNKYRGLEEFYQGSVGADSNDIIDLIHENGIYLLMHAEKHIKDGVSSSRVFEAAAANVLIISDKNKFVMDNFADNVLYFDHTQSTDKKADEIIKHVEWIKANPEQAKKMAANCHEIFLEKFTMEKQLIKLAKMHEYILERDKKKGYRFPINYD